LQIHQYQNVIDQATPDQKKLQASDQRLPEPHRYEPEYRGSSTRLLTRDNDNAQAFYRDLLAKRAPLGWARAWRTSRKASRCTLRPGRLAESPSFPVRPLLAAGGVSGLALGFLVAIFLEFSDKSIRTEKDATAVMDLPLADFRTLAGR
jgi:hypothetical protein